MNDSKPDIRRLTIEMVLGTISEADKEILDAAIKDPETHRLYEGIIERMNDPINVRESESWNPDPIKQKIASHIAQTSSRVTRLKTSLYISAAAAACVAIFCGIYFWRAEKNSPAPALVSEVIFTDAGGKKLALKTDSTNQQLTSGNISISVSNNTLRYHFDGVAMQGQVGSLQVPVGKEYTVELSDHSIVHLNAASTMIFPVAFDYSSSATRDITIKGEAFITVAQDASHPFNVHLPNGTVQVLGTSFNVNAYSLENTVVSLVSGKIRVARDQSTVMLEPGQESFAEGSKLGVRKFDSAKVRAWENGRYIFEDAKLPEIADVLNRYYGVHLDMSGIDSSDYLYTGTLYKYARLPDFLYELTEVLHLRYTLDGDKVALLK
jgi:hypothetical protein